MAVPSQSMDSPREEAAARKHSMGVFQTETQQCGVLYALQIGLSKEYNFYAQSS